MLNHPITILSLYVLGLTIFIFLWFWLWLNWDNYFKCKRWAIIYSNEVILDGDKKAVKKAYFCLKNNITSIMLKYHCNEQKAIAFKTYYLEYIYDKEDYPDIQLVKIIKGEIY